jgi:hypothetical protein
VDYSNYLIESDDQTFSSIQEAIRRLLLEGLDVRLTPISRNRALLPRHIPDAIEIQYRIDPWAYLQTSGLHLDKVRAITDDEALALVSNRANAELDEQAHIVVPPVNGVQWHLAHIRAPQAWAQLGGPDNIAWTCKVGQIDTGFTRHPALGFTGGGPSAWFKTSECRNFFTPDPGSTDVQGLPDGVDPCSGPFWGHGTRIGAAISGWHPGGDAGETFYGCAPKVPHVMVRISNSVLINNQLPALAEALDYLVNQAQVDVINLSMGTALLSYISPAVKQEINNAYDKGVIFVCAGGQHIKKVIAPARHRRTIAVGGITSKDLVWAKASRGPEIDWSAPAADIRRATRDKPTGPFIYKNDGDGTSYATALSTGVAAMWLTYRRDAILNAYPQPWMRVAAFKEIARTTARIPLPPAPWGPGVAGTGILDAAAVLTATLPTAASLAGKKEAPV